jgi:pilus assembly protein TadC
MTKNMGTLDRALRFAAALLIAVLYFTGVISGTVAIILGIIAVVFLLTSFVGTCPAYLPFGLSTRRTPAH